LIAVPPLNVDARLGLDALVDKSLLHVEEDAWGHPWYTMLETVRELALERLEASPEASAVRRRHAWYYLRLIEQADPRNRRQDVLVKQLEREQANFRAAIDWCEAHGYAEASFRLGLGLVWFWGVWGRISEGRGRLEALLARFPCKDASQTRARVHARVLESVAKLCLLQGDLQAARSFELRSLELMERFADVPLSAPSGEHRDRGPDALATRACSRPAQLVPRLHRDGSRRHQRLLRLSQRPVG
jgi:hypothetical protein